MFKRLVDAPPDRVTITIDGQPYEAHTGETVAAAVLAGGIGHTRTTLVSGTPRAPFCLMGVCYDCLMVIDGRPNQRACRVTVRQGMRIERQHGAGELPK